MNCWGPVACQSLSVVTRDWKYIYLFYDEKGITTSVNEANLVRGADIDSTSTAFRVEVLAMVTDWNTPANQTILNVEISMPTPPAIA